MVKKKTYKALGIITAAAVIYFLFKKKKPSPMATSGTHITHLITNAIVTDALRRIYNQYGREKTSRLEQLYRKETRNFTSGQFVGTFSPGMEPSPQTNTTFPFGWSSLQSFATTKGYTPNQFYLSAPYVEGGTGIRKKFIGFPDLYSAMLFVMYIIEKRGWNFGKWRAFDETISNNYNASLNNYVPSITNTF